MRAHFRRCHALQTDVESDCNCTAQSEDLELMMEALEDEMRIVKEENKFLKSKNDKFQSILEACNILTDIVLNQVEE